MPQQRQRGREPNSHLMDYQMNQAGTENSGQAFAIATLNAAPKLTYEDVTPRRMHNRLGIYNMPQ